MKHRLVTAAEDMLRTARELEASLSERPVEGEGDDGHALTDDEWRALSLALFVRALFEAPAKPITVTGPRIAPKGRWINCGCRSVGECTHGTPYWREAYPGAEKRALRYLGDIFSEKMREKMYAKAGEKAGWAEDSFTVEKIKAALVEHILKGDPVDVANFAAFWWNRLRKEDTDDVE